MSTTILASLVSAVVGALVIYARKNRRNLCADDDASGAAAYILENTVTHARVLPRPSAHAFTYPTLAFLLSVNALETHALDLGRGWLFGYGGTSWRLTGLRGEAYLLPDDDSGKIGRVGARSLKEKLADVLRQYGRDAKRVQAWAEDGDAWMLTMPSYIGFEGINPLTVYFCYTPHGQLDWVVLEIHNTFGEKHVHVLKPGFYVVSVRAPPPPKSVELASSPRPKIRIQLHSAGPDASQKPADEADALEPTLGPLKLTAALSARRAVPLTCVALLAALARYPFALFLSFARILYHASILHYRKRLDVFPRPDPKPAAQGWGAFAPQERERTEGVDRVHGGVGWQPEGVLETYARGLVERFLSRRADELGVAISLVSGDPSVAPRTFRPSRSDGQQHARTDLAIHYVSPRFFTTLVLAPSAEHMLLLGKAEDLFRVNSESRYLQAFAPAASAAPSGQSSLYSMTQRLRTILLPRRFVLAPAEGTEGQVVPPTHPLDGDHPLRNALVVCALHLMDHLEKAVFTLLRARFVPGLEPWSRWERAASAAQDERYREVDGR
ncbi:hypothetical protein BN946_scf184989.g45 [Trametes cinnabarina]|uniref:DUF1365-domain-containing protein n=1 Tax=Pycnoporus cinnabarinus TaxID=5643 RepID=A0A060S931_PYCCI|nr:hypothetical protein BN946_scf184989.g45 [Trametes cinnabarina]